MKALLTIAALAVALVIPTAASAGNPYHHHGKKHHHHMHHQPAPTPVPTPEPTPPPVVEEPHAQTASFCISSNEGVTYVQLTEGAMDAGMYWRNLYDTNATVEVAGRTITFVNKGAAGITFAFVVPGVGSTC